TLECPPIVKARDLILREPGIHTDYKVAHIAGVSVAAALSQRELREFRVVARNRAVGTRRRDVEFWRRHFARRGVRSGRGGLFGCRTLFHLVHHGLHLLLGSLALRRGHEGVLAVFLFLRLQRPGEVLVQADDLPAL